jgi:hypothetical protein
MNTTTDELELARVCTNCNNCFPSEPFASDFAICLNDPEFEPYLDEILEGQDFSRCQDLVRQKRFSWEQEACPDFDPIESSDEGIPLSSELSSAIDQLAKDGHLTAETFQQAIYKDMLDKIDWANVPVEDNVENLNNAKTLKKRSAAVQSLGGLISLNNKAAFNALFSYLKDLPPPITVEQTHFRVEILRQLKHTHKFRKKLARLLVKDLFRTPSNNKTRGWYTAVFRFFEGSSVNIAKETLAPMLVSPQFSYRIKKRIKNILERLND